MGGSLKATAVVIGEAAGTVVSLAGSVMHQKAAPKPTMHGKLAKKQKSRLPRKAKKAAAKAQNHAAQSR